MLTIALGVFIGQLVYSYFNSNYNVKIDKNNRK